ncbi:MAG TPA: DUF2157 domain-containing protein [Thiotrichales bacterium]|nr:DUF2157 domain-containing protein [Thiotrichales bacterium]
MTLPSHNGTSRSEAQERADRIRAFDEELAALGAAGVLALDEAQRQSIDDYHKALLSGYSDDFDIDRDRRAKQLSLGMRITSFLGALALAASVFFLFYQFWGQFSTTVQVGILIVASLLSFVGTLILAERERTGYFAKLAALVGLVCFALNIALLGQVFNLYPSQNVLLLWAAYALLMAYACDIRLLLGAGILCFTAWLSAQTGTWGGMYWLGFGERPENFFPAALLLFFLPQWLQHRRHPDFAPVYRVFGLLCLLLPILVLSNAGFISYLPFAPDTIEGGYQLAGFLLSAGAIWLGIRRHWNDTFNTGNVFFVIFLYTKFFDWWWDSLPKYLFFFLLGLTAVGLLLVFKRLRARAAMEGVA